MKTNIQIGLLLVIFSFLYACSDDMGDQEFDDVMGSDATFEGTDPNGGDNGNGIPQAGTITAGEWNDLENWYFWTNLLQNNPNFSESLSVWGINTSQRYAFTVLGNDDQPITGARIELLSQSDNVIWQNMTDINGNAELWLNVFGGQENAIKAKVTYNNNNYQIDNLINSIENRNIVNLPIEVLEVEVLDIVFIMDATGSMDDELEFLKTELQDVIDRVQQAQTNLTIKLGATFYRDHGDEYLVRNYPLTIDINSIVEAVKQQSASGGGDYEEAVDKALETAIIQQSWSSKTSVKLVFLILDAPPHSDYQIITQIQQAIKVAATQGVKIIPITASGVNIDTELLMRAIAIVTNGTYCFITDDSGVGNDHLEPTVGEYEVELLNDLMVRLINKYSNSNAEK